MPTGKKDKDIISRLNVIISLLLDPMSQDKKKKPQMLIVKRLRQLGLTNKEIAPIVVKNTGQVAKLFYETKRKKRG